MSKFKRAETNPSQGFMFARSLDEMLEADAPVRAFNRVLDRLDWQALEASYPAVGRPSYDPRILASLLIYAYSQGIRSSRKIEDLARYDLRYMWLACEMKPDYRTFARFRKGRWELLKMLFAQSVRLCMAEGLVDLEMLAVDGTRVKGQASGRSIYDKKRIEEELGYAEAVLKEAEAADGDDEASGDPPCARLPRKIEDPQGRLDRLKDLEQELEDKGAKTISASDPESALMKVGRGTHPGYNTQAAVDAAHQVVVAIQVTDYETDYGLMPGVLDDVEEICGAKASVVLADAGYSDERTLLNLEERGQGALIVQRRASSVFTGDPAFAIEAFSYDAASDSFVCPSGRPLSFRRYKKKAATRTVRIYTGHDCRSCPFHDRCVPRRLANRTLEVCASHHLRLEMLERVRSEEGKAQLALRKKIVEPVFGQWKYSRKLDRLVTWGLNGAWSEMSLMAIAHNLARVVQCLILLILRSIADLPAHAGPSEPFSAPTAERPLSKSRSPVAA